MKANNKTNGKANKTNNATATENGVKIQVFITDYNAKEYTAKAESKDFAPGLWVVTKRGASFSAQHFEHENIIPQSTKRIDVFRGLKAFRKYMDEIKTVELAAREFNPDIKARLRTNNVTEFFVVTADGKIIQQYDRKTSDWENTGYFPSDRTIRKSSKDKGFDRVRACNAALELFGYSDLITDGMKPATAKADKAKESAPTTETDSAPAPTAGEVEQAA